jgi:PAS domain-containing protein
MLIGPIMFLIVVPALQSFFLRTRGATPPAPVLEPADGRHCKRHVEAADAEADHEAEGDVELPELPDLAGEHQACAQQHAAAQHKLSEKTQHLDMAINNMTQGLLLFDASGRLVICNQQYIDMFGVSPEIVKPGCHLRDLILHRQEQGTFVGDVDAYCAKFLNPMDDGVQTAETTTPDGRTIRLIYQRSPDGGWATTLEDVTEGRRVQARIEHLFCATTTSPAVKRCCAGGIRCAAWFRRPISFRSPRIPA